MAPNFFFWNKSILSDGQVGAGPLFQLIWKEEMRSSTQSPILMTKSIVASGEYALVWFAFQQIVRIYLCNPAIHQFRELPDCSPSAIPGYNLFGFGYLDSRKEYKVVHFFYMGPRCLLSDVQLAQLRCEVFTLNGGGISNGRWKEIAEPPPYHPYLPGLLVNECMYWLAADEIQYYAQPRVISFDFVENGKFITITCPSAFEILFGLDLKGKACLADYIYFRSSSILDLWILEDKISSTWVKECSINLVSFMSKNIMSLLMPWNEELMFVNSDMIVLYDFKRNCCRGVKIFGIRTLFSLDP